MEGYIGITLTSGEPNARLVTDWNGCAVSGDEILDGVRGEVLLQRMDQSDALQQW